MNEAAIHALARRAGIDAEWTDYADKPHRVTTESLVRILEALGLPCRTRDEIAHSETTLAPAALPPLVTAKLGETIRLPISGQPPSNVKLTMEDGTAAELKTETTQGGVELLGIGVAGYHTLDFGGSHLTLAVAPPRCVTVADLTGGEPSWGIAAQLYGLRRPGDCGIGDASGAAALAIAAAAEKADALALSPIHALFSADPNHFSPYSPSSRLFYNPLYADPRIVFGAERVAQAAERAKVASQCDGLAQLPLIEWPASANTKLAIFRKLFEDFAATDLAAGGTPLAAEFAQFRTSGGKLLEDHARFEALQAQMLRENPSLWSWTDWPMQWRDPNGAAVAEFAARNAHEVGFHCFLQWIADRSFAATQRAAKDGGMRIGLIGDLAVGMSGAGSHAWTSQKDILVGLEIGAPPDLYNANGQNWGLTTFSPRALVQGGFVPFIATLRAGLRHAGGLRIDHAMGLLRLWVVPRGAAARDGAYLHYPLGDLLRLIALESRRHRAIVIGEDLGTVPEGFRDTLAAAGIYGMRVLWFERGRKRFTPPRSWSRDSAAMTSTHDLPTVAGWWRGADIDTRAALGLADAGTEREGRKRDRASLWHAFRRTKVATEEEPSPTHTADVVEAALRFTAKTSSELALLPLEDILGLEEQPNLPGTIEQHPNWRRRYPGSADTLLRTDAVRRRLAPLKQRGRS
ncbi:MAG TPA: 4-alpha-glucanotransferase [Xanthobacteraceae bacterium]|jgi:4-alpha-glucanotransferase|nr:4-alpha-glucanotransferase [Xanthobacteraceae bacterium]